MSDKPLTDITFSTFDLHPDLLAGLEGAGFTRCTPIQAMTLPVALPGGAVARVAAVGGDADAGAQSLRVRAQLEAGSGLLPGQQLDVTLRLPAPAGALAVPASALLQEGDGHLLFVQEDGAWRGLPVRRLGGDDRVVIVIGEGLRAGMPVASAGANLLKTLTAGE